MPVAWTVQELVAASEMCVPTLPRMDSPKGPVPGRYGTVEKVKAALEKEGIQFLAEGDEAAGPGVAKRQYERSPVARSRLLGVTCYSNGPWRRGRMSLLARYSPLSGGDECQTVTADTFVWSRGDCNEQGSSRSDAFGTIQRGGVGRRGGNSSTGPILQRRIGQG